MRRWKLGTDCGHRQLVFPRSSVGSASLALKGSAGPRPSLRMGIELKAAMTNSDAPAPRRPHPPVMDALGKLCTEGKQLADYLWQVPKDEPARQRILALLDQIAAESTKQGRHEMPKICEELKTPARATPRPQQVDMLVSGFDRLLKPLHAAQNRVL